MTMSQQEQAIDNLFTSKQYSQIVSQCETLLKAARSRYTTLIFAYHCVSLIILERYKRALELIEECAELELLHSTVFECRLYCYDRQGKYNDVVEHFYTYVESHTPSEVSLELAANAHIHNEHFAGAIKLFEKALGASAQQEAKYKDIVDKFNNQCHEYVEDLRLFRPYPGALLSSLEEKLASFPVITRSFYDVARVNHAHQILNLCQRLQNDVIAMGVANGKTLLETIYYISRLIVIYYPRNRYGSYGYTEPVTLMEISLEQKYMIPLSTGYIYDLRALRTQYRNQIHIPAKQIVYSS